MIGKRKKVQKNNPHLLQAQEALALLQISRTPRHLKFSHLDDGIVITNDCLQWMVHGWLIGWFWFKAPFRQSGRLPEKKERNDRRGKNVQTAPPTPPASAVDPCPIIFQISRTRQTGGLSITTAPPDHPRFAVDSFSMPSANRIRNR